MAKSIQKSLEWCENCNKKTIHFRETKQMSWLMHLVLTIFTGGIWLIFFLLTSVFHVFTKPMGGKKTCSQCGFEH